MNNIVLELQKDCLEDNSKVSSIIRKAYVISSKLNIQDFSNWAQKELNGYPKELIVFPEYREVDVEYKAFNPYRGWIPVMIPTNSEFAILLKQKVFQSIEQIETLLNTVEGQISFNLNADIQQMMTSNGSANFEIRGFIGRIQLVGILKAVRNIILDWTLKLEQNGILGTGLSFTTEEKEKAATGILNYGMIVYGNIENSQVVGSGDNNNQTLKITETEIKNLEKLIDLIEKNKPNIDLNVNQIEELNVCRDQLKNEIQTTKNKSKIKSILLSIKTIFEQIVGNVIASGIVYEIAKLLPK